MDWIERIDERINDVCGPMLLSKGFMVVAPVSSLTATSWHLILGTFIRYKNHRMVC
jgi:hypothetical protein